MRLSFRDATTGAPCELASFGLSREPGEARKRAPESGEGVVPPGGVVELELAPGTYHLSEDREDRGTFEVIAGRTLEYLFEW